MAAPSVKFTALCLAGRSSLDSAASRPLFSPGFGVVETFVGAMGVVVLGWGVWYMFHHPYVFLPFLKGEVGSWGPLGWVGHVRVVWGVSHHPGWGAPDSCGMIPSFVSMMWGSGGIIYMDPVSESYWGVTGHRVVGGLSGVLSLASLVVQRCLTSRPVGVSSFLSLGVVPCSRYGSRVWSFTERVLLAWCQWLRCERFRGVEEVIPVLGMASLFGLAPSEEVTILAH